MAEYTASVQETFDRIANDVYGLRQTQDAATTDISNRVTRGEGWVDLRKQPNVVGNGTTDDAAAINTALNSATALGLRVYAYGTFKVSSTVFFSSAVDFDQATFTWGGTSGTVVHVGGINAFINKPAGQIRLPKVVNTKSGAGWAQANVVGTIGVKIQRLYTTTIVVQEVSNFETGLLVYGATDGVSYCHVWLGALENNKVNFKMDTDGVGWVNQNWFYGGRFSHYSNEGTLVVGTRHIHVTRTIGVNGAPNTNTFIGASLESVNTVEFHLDMDRGLYNLFINCRFETTSGNGRVRWGDGAQYNKIDQGYGVSEIVQTKDAAAIGNMIDGGKYQERAYGVKGAIWENANSSASPVLTLMAAGANAANADPTTAYCAKFGAITWSQKSAADAFDRFQVSNGAMKFGPGTSAPVLQLNATSSTMLLGGGSFAPNATGTLDLGLTSLNWRDIFLSRHIRLGTLYLRDNAGAFEKSTNGTTWTPVDTTGGTTDITGKADKLGSVDIEITDATKGVILRSPDASRWRLTVGNDGAITTTKVV